MMHRKKITVLLLTIALTGCGHKPAQVTAPPVSAVEQLQTNASASATASASASVSASTAVGSHDLNMKETSHASMDASQSSTSFNLKQHVTYSGPRSLKKVALTFDDGPDAKYTPQIIDILKKENVSATFFVTGEHAAAHPEVMKLIVNSGFEIGNHSWDHSNLTTLDSQRLADEIDKTDEVIQRFTGKPSTLVRPPYGALSKEVVDYAEKAHQIICWSVDTRDWEGISAEKIVENVKKEVKPGAIILQHSAGGKKGNLSNTVAALPQLIHYLKEHGYQFATVSELVQQNQG